jgi:hypothetical protein
MNWTYIYPQVYGFDSHGRQKLQYKRGLEKIVMYSAGVTYYIGRKESGLLHLYLDIVGIEFHMVTTGCCN